MIKSIKFASIPITDQQRSLEFFTSKLGFRVVTDHPFDETQRWIELGIPGAETKLVLFTPTGQEDRIGTFSNIVFLADDVEGTYQSLRERGVEFVQEPKSADWGSSAMFKDPDGNLFLISSR